MSYAHTDGSDCPRPVDITNMRDDPANPVYVCGCDPRTAMDPVTPDANGDPDSRTLACPDCDYRNDGMPGLLWLHRVSEHGARDPDAGTDRPPTPEPTTSGTPCPPGVHSLFDPCPGDCTEEVEDDPETYGEARARILREVREKLGETYPDLEVVYYAKPYPTYTYQAKYPDDNGRGADARPARHTAWALPATTSLPYVGLSKKVKVDPDAHVCATSRCWQDCRNKDDLVDTYTDPGLLSYGSVECRACGWSANVSDKFAGRLLGVHLMNGDCPGTTTEKGRRGIFQTIRRFWYWWTG